MATQGLPIPRATLDRLIAEYKVRVTANKGAHLTGGLGIKERAQLLRVELELVGVTRGALLDLHRNGRVDDAVLRIERDGGDYVINGRKWFITNAATSQHTHR
ncbi:hypothetical protein PWP93_25105 [Paraburkholderia sp. A1RI-2L]|uniref:hypothetical protein n=1 Tax=Paraburkholderia sp. A1RI-2L TaxID=3028367 RepID=UPI003B81EC57